MRIQDLRGINFQSLLRNWDLIIDKLCDEVSTHDILMAIKSNLQRKKEEFDTNNFDSKKLNKAILKIDEVLKLIDPEQF